MKASPDNTPADSLRAMNESNPPIDETDIDRERKAASDIAYILRALADENEDRRRAAEEELAGLIETEKEIE